MVIGTGNAFINSFENIGRSDGGGTSSEIDLAESGISQYRTEEAYLPRENNAVKSLKIAFGETGDRIIYAISAFLQAERSMNIKDIRPVVLDRE